MDALARVNLSAYESRVLWCVFRKTYGWNKKSDRISYSQYEETTGMERRHIGRTIKLLIERRMITCQGDGQQLEYSIQKDYERWQDIRQVDIKPLPKEATVETDTTIAQLGNSEIDNNHCLIRAEPLPNQDAPLPKEATKPLPKEANTKAIKHYTKALYKSIYGEFHNVLLTEEEYKKLADRFGGAGAKEQIEKLSAGIASKGYKYKDHYATILNWSRRDSAQDKKTGGDGHGAHWGHFKPLPQSYPEPGDL